MAAVEGPLYVAEGRSGSGAFAFNRHSLSVAHSSAYYLITKAAKYIHWQLKEIYANMSRQLVYVHLECQLISPVTDLKSKTLINIF